MLFDFKTFTAVMRSVWDYSGCGFEFDDAQKVFYTFFWHYEREFGAPHPPVRRTQVENILSVMDHVDDDCGRPLDLLPEDYRYMIPRYFNTEFQCCDYRINHFFSGKVRLMRYYETMCGYDDNDEEMLLL